MSRTLTVLHLSDLHISAQEFSSQRVVLKALWKDITALRRDGAVFDLVFFTGDLIAKGDYQEENVRLFRSDFVNPLLSATGLTSKSLFISPGNHDLQLPEQSALLRPNYDTLTTQDAVRGFFQNFVKTPLPTGFEGFNRLLDSLDLETPVLKTPFYRAYVQVVHGIRIGICAINSAWRATGARDDADHGKLIVGRHQIDELTSAINGTDLRLALFHHPPNWLTSFDYNSVQNQLYVNFDAVFYGHNHDADGVAIAGSFGSYFVSNAGCLYQSRDYFNGYSVVRIDTDIKTSWSVEAREYFERRQSFDASPRFAPNGKQVYTTADRGHTAALRIPSSEFLAAVSEKAQSQLLSSSISDVAPKSLPEMFVEPPLSYVSERQLNIERKGSDKSLFLTLRDVIALKKHVTFVGPKQSGKTILLLRLCCQIGELGVLNFPPFSAYVDLQNSLDTRAKILDSIVRFSDGTYRRGDFIELLRQGLVVVCFDNIDRTDVRGLRVVSEFVREFPSCRFFFAIREDVESSLSRTFLPDLGVESVVLYLHAFSRREARALIARWFGAVDRGASQKVDEILRSLRRLNVPRTPFLISALLWIKEKDVTFTQVNQSAIVDALIDGILEKLSESKARSGLDSTNKRHFLSALAEHLYRTETSRISVADLDRFAVGYFESKALNLAAGPLLEELKSRGLLIEINGHVGFKFDCIRAYFMSQRMKDVPELLDVALSKNNFVKFGDELNYLTGSTRDRADVLSKCLTLIEDYHRDANLGLELGLFDDVSLKNSPFDEARQAELTEHILGSRLLGEKREQELDRIDGASGAVLSRKAEQGGASKLEAVPKFVAALAIVSAVLRNSELVDDPKLKSRTYKVVTQYWCEVLIGVLVSVEFLEDDSKALDALSALLPLGNRALAHYFLKVLAPNVIFSLVLEYLGTAKLEVIIERSLGEDAETARKLLDAFLYVDLELPKRFVVLENLMEECGGNRLVAELIFFKLVQIYVFRDLSETQEVNVRRLLTRSISTVFSAKTRGDRDRLKNRVLEALQRHRLCDGIESAAAVSGDNSGATK